MSDRAIIRHWQHFAKRLADKLDCAAIDTDIEEAVGKLVQARQGIMHDWRLTLNRHDHKHCLCEDVYASHNRRTHA